MVRIRLKKDVDFFKKSKLFEYRFLRDRAGTGWHAAFYFLRVHGCSTDVLDDENLQEIRRLLNKGL